MNETIGSLLRETREKLGYTLDQVAMETKIQKRYLIDLETENFKDMPGMVYEKGFLKTYASLLGLDISEVMDLYEKYRFPDEDVYENKNTALDNEKKENSRKIKTIALIFILLLFISYGLYNFFVRESNSEVIVENQVVEALESLENNNIEKNLEESKLDVENSFVENYEQEINEEDMEKEVSILPKEEKEAILKEVNYESKSDDLSEKYVNKKEIQLIVKGKSWIEVYKNKQRVFYNIANSGIISVSGNNNDSIFMKVGDASQIELVYNGESQGLMGQSNQVVRKTF